MAESRLHESLTNVDRSEIELWIDGHAKDLASLDEFTQLRSLALYRLSKQNISILSGLQLPQLEALSIRLGSFSDLSCISHFVTLKRLCIWQCSKLRSLDGVSSLTDLHNLTLLQTGPLESLEPIVSLNHLEELIVIGGIFSWQALSNFEPIAKLGRKLKLLDLTGTKAENPDLSPLTKLPEPDEFGISARFYPLDQVALLVAAYPKWGSNLMKLDYKGFRNCKKCNGPTKMLFATRSRDVCPKCDSARMEKFLSEFRLLVKQKQKELHRKG